ncbi:hypothetical protein E3N88_37281 [Mikania micrantha]|uniref:Reverse transcriptase domain-containing protein n=1 Tax=Mikania micrantha TaxID=192012 RepID=A0A5N6LQK6_9ASTR|nr:hypothetical protein E3N88_37281 [Mikania micrantha]
MRVEIFGMGYLHWARLSPKVFLTQKGWIGLLLVDMNPRVLHGAPNPQMFLSRMGGRCGQQYGPAHKCPEGKLRVLLLGEDEYEISEGDNLRLEQLQVNDESLDANPALGTCLALASDGAISTCGGAKTLKFEGTLQGIPISLMVDSGATHNFISRRLVMALGLRASSFSGIHITLGDGYSVFVKDQCSQLSISIGSFQFLIDVLVFDTGNLDLILGMAWLSSLGEVTLDWHHSWMQFHHEGQVVRLQGSSVVHSNSAALQQWLGELDEDDLGHATFCAILSANQQQALDGLLQGAADVFAAPTGLPPARSHDHSIQLTSDVPICVRPYRYPHIHKAEIERQVMELLKLGMIRPSKSAYSSPVILVHKKDNTWRMCVDYRALNNATIPDKYPIPVVEELLDELYGSLFFTKLDLKSGYNQIRMSPNSIEKTAFRTHDGHYEFLVMPFGLTNAPATFQAVMNDIFRPLLRKKVVIFFDDILIYSPTWDAHLADLQMVFQVLSQHQFTVNRTKCSFGQTSVDYLGHVIDGFGVSMDQKKVEAVKSWPVPKHVTGLRGGPPILVEGPAWLFTEDEPASELPCELDPSTGCDCGLSPSCI